jgi:hypothetical protein
MSSLWRSVGRRPTVVLVGIAIAGAPLAGDDVQTAAVSGVSAQAGGVPTGYDPRPEGAGLLVRPRIGASGFTASVTNEGADEVVGLTFVAVVESVGFRKPVRILRSEPWSVALGPGRTTSLTAAWLASAELERLKADAAPDRIQIFLAVDRVRYRDGSQWQLTIDPSATNHRDALGPRAPNQHNLLPGPAPEIPASLNGQTPPGETSTP